jgi:hypothetical protein
VVIGDAAVASVANVALAEETHFDEFDVRAVGDGDLLVAPEEGQFEASVFFDHVFQGRFQFGRCDVLVVDPFEVAQRHAGTT